MHLQFNHLPMWGVREQGQRRGSTNAAYLQVTSTGVQDAALTLFRKVQEVLKGRPQDQTYLADLDRLRDVVAAAQASLNGVADLADPDLDPDEQRKRLATVQGIRARSATRAGRDAQTHVERAVGEAVVRLKQSLLQAMASGPDRVRPLAEQVRRQLQEIRLPESGPEPVARLQRLVKARDQVHACRSAVMPATFDAVDARLRGEARQAYEGALRSLALDLTGEALRRALPKLLEFLDELASRGAIFLQRVREALAHLEGSRRLAAREEHVSHASVVLPLAGPDERQVLAGMTARNGCTDAAQLATRLLDQLEARLRQAAPQLCPHVDVQSASFADIVCAVEPRHLAEAFQRLVEESLGGGHSVYEVIARHGVDASAEFLYGRAEPTCHLGDLDVEEFNVSPVDLTVVRLPPPAAPRDHVIRQELVALLNRRAANCEITEGAAADRTVTVVRLHAGYPIGIDQDNAALLERYLKAGERGHPPHLIGVVPDAPLGVVSPRIQSLQRRPPLENHND